MTSSLITIFSCCMYLLGFVVAARELYRRGWHKADTIMVALFWLPIVAWLGFWNGSAWALRGADRFLFSDIEAEHQRAATARKPPEDDDWNPYPAGQFVLPSAPAKGRVLAAPPVPSPPAQGDWRRAHK